MHSRTHPAEWLQLALALLIGLAGVGALQASGTGDLALAAVMGRRPRRRRDTAALGDLASPLECLAPQVAQGSR